MVSADYPRFLRVPRGSFFLFGARGTGKSTWTKQSLPGAHRVDLLDESLYQTLLADPSRFAGELSTLPPRSWVIVDEVQRLPGLLHEVHRFIADRSMRFALLGSSARKLKAAGTNLLAGRAIHKSMFPFVPEELGADFALDRVLRFGSIPVIWTSPDPKAALGAYVELYLSQEIKAEALVRNLPGFARFLPIAALFHGQVVNVSGIARDAACARTTIDGYLEILEDTLLAWRLAAYEARLRVRERKHPKLYWIDPGLVRAAKRQLGPLAVEERGSLLEGWVHMILRAYGAERELFDEIFYWAPTQARFTEVDFLLRRGKELLAIEVKANARTSGDALVGLRAVAELEHLARRILVHTGPRPLRTADGIDVLPIATFLDAVREDTLWP